MRTLSARTYSNITTRHSCLLCSVPSDKGPSLRPLTSKSSELELPLLRADEDEDSPGGEDSDCGQEISLH